MRAPRLALAAVTCCAVLVPWSGSASAATHRTVVLHAGLPNGASLLGESCSNDAGAPTEAVHVTGPGKPPLGKGSLAFGNEADQLLVPHIAQQPAANLTAFSFSYDGVSQSGEPAALTAQIDLTVSPDTVASLSATLLYTGHWVTANLLTATLDDTETTSGTTTDDGTTTYAQYLSAHPSAQISDAFLEVYNCGELVGNALAIDALSLGIKGATTTYDFEPDSALRLTATAARRSHRGAPVAITGFLDRGKAAVAGIPLVLQARPKGTKAWLDTATVDTTYNGGLYAVELPTTTTAFRWTFAGCSDAGAITSKATTVTIVKPPKKKHKHTKHRHARR
jgi:hypothetical protein